MVKCEKLSTGLTDPIAGPILPRDDAAAPIADIKSNPNRVKITDEVTKINM